MKKLLLTVPLAALLCAQAAAARQKPATQPTPKQTPAPAQPQQQRPAPPVASLGLTDYGIEIAPDARLVAMMAALDAAGWDPTPQGARPSVYRELVRREQSGLDPALRKRMQDFYARNALKDAADDPATPENEAVRYTPADQAARYISLAYTLGQPPAFDAPARSEDLPAGVLEVLDFVPLLSEFYKASGMDARLPNYLGMHRAAGDKLRAQTLDMARGVLSYLNTRPETLVSERVNVTPAAPSQGKKKPERPTTVLREHVRRFRVVPDLMAAPGAINLRAVGDDYFAIVPSDTDPRLSEMRRAYVQFVVDPLVARFSREVAARRPDIKRLLEAEQVRRGRAFGPDVFLTVARSLVAAADARMDELVRLRALQLETSRRLQASTDPSAKEAALKDSKERQAVIQESTTAQLAEAYERGAVLSFHFADQLRGFEDSGFDVANYMVDMVAAFTVERELKRPAEFTAVVARVRERRSTAVGASETPEVLPTDERRAALIKGLNDVGELLRLRNYEEANTRLTALKGEYANEPLVYFTLGQAASLAAQEAIDEALQAERLNAALGHFRQAILFATPDTDPSVVARAHLSSGRILAHLERRDDALREFDAVISATKPTDRLYQEALAEKKKLGQ